MIRPRRRNGATEGNGTAGSTHRPHATAESRPRPRRRPPRRCHDEPTGIDRADGIERLGELRTRGRDSATHPTVRRPTPAADADARSRRRRRRAVARRRRRRQPAPAPAARARPRRSQRTAHRATARRTAASRGSDDYSGDLIDIEGLLDLRDEGYGFLRVGGYLPGRNDAYVSASQVRRFGLRKGDHVQGATRPPASSEKYPALVRVDVDQRDDARRSAQPRPLRGSDAAVPRLAVAARARRRPGRDHRPHHRPDLADREGPARSDRVAAEGGQDDDHQADRVLDRAQQPRDARDGAARRRAARGSHRHAPPRAARRGRGVDLRPALRRALPRRRARDRARPPARRDRTGRRHHPRRHHPARPGVQPRGAGVRPHHVGRCRLLGAVPAEEVLRCGAEYRRGWVVDDPCDRAHRHRLEDGRSDLRGVQGHRQHGAAPRPARRRPPRLPGHRRRAVEHPARRAALRPRSICSRRGSSDGC